VEAEPESTNRVGEVARLGPSLTAIVPVLAPATVGATALLYLAGWSKAYTQLKYLGLSPTVISEPLQVTLAQGYLPVLLGAVLALGFVGLLWLAVKLENLFWTYVIPMLPNWKPSRLLERALIAVSPYNRMAYIATVAMVALTFAAFAGAGVGFIAFAQAENRVLSGCHTNCFTYVTDYATVTGTLIAQDGNRTILLTSEGARIVKTEAITLIRPYIPHAQPTAPPARPPPAVEPNRDTPDLR
jgi:hypothetical protein